MNTMVISESTEVSAIHAHLTFSPSTTPGGIEEEETDRRSMEPERPDDRKLEELSLEVYGY